MACKRVLLSWSGGKDSAWALHLLRQDPSIEVAGLLTTVNQHFHRTAMHGVREELLDLQASAAELPLHKVSLPWPCSNAHYEAAMADACARATQQGIDAMAFGDLFLEDIRAYREQRLAPTGLEPLFPCWLLPTRELAHTLIRSGLRTHLVCVDPRVLDRSFAGRLYDEALLRDLPASVDPCAERGEFHTFVSAGPMFSSSIEVRAGEVVERDGFVYADFLPASAS